jgi:hypothetical protein
MDHQCMLIINLLSRMCDEGLSDAVSVFNAGVGWTGA